MPLRIRTLQRLGPANLCLRPAQQSSTTPSFLPLVQTANLSMREKKRKQKQDPYKWAQAQQRKNANLGRREELEKTRQEGWGDGVMGQTTPFLESLDSVGRKTPASASATDGTTQQNQIPTAGMRNYFLNEAELEAAVSEAYTLTKPMVGLVESQMDSNAQEEREQQHEQRHERAVEALRRITSMENSSARDRFHANVRRIVDEFGRHNTDAHLRQRPESVLHPKDTEVPGRAGPDTGSSEVQIAILTTKIRGLATALQMNRGYKDKHNQRNLRLLMHRRQKLLKYMERKERGSERWTNMLEKLGLTPAMWKQQI